MLPLLTLIARGEGGGGREWRGMSKRNEPEEEEAEEEGKRGVHGKARMERCGVGGGWGGGRADQLRQKLLKGQTLR